jgi:predicted amidohydrolase YtcJ
MTQPNLVLYNASIHTMDPQKPIASAVAISDDRIAAVGDGDSLCRSIAPGGQAIDLNGRTVIPGLIDAHLHFTSYSLRLDLINIHELPSLEETLARVAERALISKPGTWVRGGGWNCNLWSDGAFPSRHDLDRVAPDNPVALSSKDGHSLWINTRAMALAMIGPDTPDVPGGSIFRDPSGMPTGIVQENAIGLVSAVFPQPTHEEMVAACKRGIDRAHRVGLTGIHNCEGAAALAVFQDLARRGELSMRVLAHIPEDALEAAIAVGLRDGFGSEWVRTVGIKAFSDGALGSRSAWMLAPYEDHPENLGIPTTTPEALRRLVRTANEAGLGVAIHAIGDAANRTVLDAIADARSSGAAQVRNRIEHVQLLHADDIPRLAQLGVVASMQPIHATADIDIVERYWGRRGSTSYAWRSLLDAGTVIAFGSDAPVESISPLVGIHAAVTRRRADGYPGPDGWYPKQRLTVDEAVYAYTMGAAYAGGEEHLKGSLAPGKLADLVILDQDIFTVAPMDILQTRVLGTVVGGEFAYRSETL